MAGESESRRKVASTTFEEQTFVFGTIVRAIWPYKPALHLAQRIHSTERAAQFYIDGERKITARCVQAIVNEMLPD